MVLRWTGEPAVLGSKWAQPVLVTLAIGGLQFAWGIEQAYVTIYLLELGMSKAGLSLIWVAGPTCGLIVQPTIGAISDYWCSRNGRRRPFIVSSTLVAIAGLLTFAWAEDISKYFDGALSPIVIATLSVLIVDVAINVCGACLRALIVDVFPSKRQRTANAWAGRMSAVGHLGSYFLGTIDMIKLGFHTQLKGVCAVSSVLFLLCTLITSVAVTERQLVSGTNIGVGSRLKHIVWQLVNATLHLDRQLAAIFKVQLFGWYAWFTFLFYGATWAGEVWRKENGSKDTGAMARAGAGALVAFSSSSTLCSLLLPLVPMDITSLWSVSYLIYTAAAISTAFITQYWAVLVCFVAVGIPWAMTLWAPFALTSKRIHQLPAREEPSSEEASIETHLTVMSQDPEEEDESNLTDGAASNAGIYLGIHNTAITLPQFLSTFGSFIVFRVLDTDPNHPHDDGGRAIAITLQMGSIAAILAAYYAFRVKKVMTDYDALPNAASPITAESDDEFSD